MKTTSFVLQRFLFVCTFFLLTLFQLYAASVSDAEDFANQSVSFSEIWGYLYSSEGKTFSAPSSVSDIGYFGAGLSLSGRLTGVPVRSSLNNFQGRVHLVVAEVSNRALTHLCLDTSLPLRNQLISDLITATKDYDGLQIDFELVLPEDDQNFFSFLQELKKGIGSKPLSVAIPARTKKLKQDAYDYKRIATVADRVIVMAYDEHWSGSTPGPIASMAWSKKVSKWALSCFGPERLVMGLPFYGRAWADVNPAKAYRHPTLQCLMEEKGVQTIERIDGIPRFTYTQDVTVTVYYEDAISTFTRSRMYRDAGIPKIAFWKLGQEDPAIWDRLFLD